MKTTDPEDSAFFAHPENRYTNTIMPCVYVTFMRRPKYSIYTSAAVGIRFSKYDHFTEEKPTTFAYDLALPGVRFGNKFAGFLELGFGAKGLIRGGISLSF